MNYKIYTDGATSGNGYEGAQGGYAFVILRNDEITLLENGFVEDATNNICELEAIIQACITADSLADYNYEDEPLFTIYSDSAYIVNCYKDKWYKKWQKNGWLNSKRQPVANKEYWEKLIPYFEDSRFSIEKVKGHSGNQLNELVDKMAVAARQDKGLEEFEQFLGLRVGEVDGRCNNPYI